MSSYEVFFKDWLDVNPFVLSYEQQPERFIFDGLETNKKKLFHPVKYTPDFLVYWTEEAKGILYEEIGLYTNQLFIAQPCETGFCSLIEIKSEYDFKNSTQMSMLRMKWLYDVTGEYTNLIKPFGGKRCLFSKTYCPDSAAYTKTGKLRALKFEHKTITQWLQEFALLAEAKQQQKKKATVKNVNTAQKRTAQKS